MCKISVIIPTYNRLIFLKRSVESVLNQSYQNFELIVVDDGSNDKTKEYCLNQPRIKYFYQKNKGVSAARNLGIKYSKGEYISFLDSDDEFLPKKLEKQINYLVRNPSIKILHSNEIWIRNGIRVNECKKHKKLGGFIYNNSLKLCLISPSAVIMKKEIFNEIGLFDEEFTYAEDYDLWLRITPYYEVGFIEEYLIKKYGGHDDQLSKNWGIDHFRVIAMEKMLKDKNLSLEYKQETIKILLKKLKILEKTFRKHSRIKQADIYLKKLKYYNESNIALTLSCDCDKILI